MFPFPLSLVGWRWLVRRREFPGHGAGTRRPGSGLCARRPVELPPSPSAPPRPLRPPPGDPHPAACVYEVLVGWLVLFVRLVLSVLHPTRE